MKSVNLLLFLVFLVSCASIKNNKNQFLSIEQQKFDIDFAFQKIEELHPNIYQYINKEKLNFKVDSLKNSLKNPLSPLDFYFKFQPLISEIKQGHLSLRIPQKKLSPHEIDILKNKKALFHRFRYYIKDNQLFIIKNKDSVFQLQPGTEILSINGENVSDYISKYRSFISSDGENTSYKNYFLKDTFFNFYTAEKGLLDSAYLKIKYNNTIDNIVLKRENKATDKLKYRITSEQKLKDYDIFNETFNRQFSYLDKDSTIAYLQIKSFSEDYSKKFYKRTFLNLRKAKSQYLIIDIRNNYGGSLSEIYNIYSYLSTTPYTLLKPSEITSKKSIYKTNYFYNTSSFKYPIKLFSYPGYFLTHTLHVSKHTTGRIFYKMKEAKSHRPNPNRFQGKKIYLLTNGGTFSAAAIIAAKLKNDQLATLVGEETGGANDGTVAGFYSHQTLPYSKLDLPIGLISIKPNINFSLTNKGVIPDIIIQETLQDIINPKDPVLEYIICEIKEKIDFNKKELSNK